MFARAQGPLVEISMWPTEKHFTARVADDARTAFEIAVASRRVGARSAAAVVAIRRAPSTTAVMILRTGGCSPTAHAAASGSAPMWQPCRALRTSGLTAVSVAGVVPPLTLILLASWQSAELIHLRPRSGGSGSAQVGLNLAETRADAAT